jgi:preprotein translocase subunit SecG
MEQILLIVHLLVALVIIGLIMLQQGKGADAGASFGAGASQTIFGSDGSGNVLTRATSWLVVAFFATSFGLAMVASQKSKPVDDLGLSIPAVEMVQPQAESDLPQIEDEFPEASSMNDDLPSVEDDFPEPAAAVDATDGDIPTQ